MNGLVEPCTPNVHETMIAYAKKLAGKLSSHALRKLHHDGKIPEVTGGTAGRKLHTAQK